MVNSYSNNNKRPSRSVQKLNEGQIRFQYNEDYHEEITYEDKLPEGVTAKVTRNVIDISGANKELVGFTAAKIRSFRPPEPYKGKGVKYANETIIRKAGKAGAKK